MQLPTKTLDTEYCQSVAVLHESSHLIVNHKKRSSTIKSQDLLNFHGERGRRGLLLPKSFRSVQSIEPKTK